MHAGHLRFVEAPGAAPAKWVRLRPPTYPPPADEPDTLPRDVLELMTDQRLKEVDGTPPQFVSLVKRGEWFYHKHTSGRGR